jgi:ubiquinone/menaquinone biosynthesis C-methylase UbiE
MSDPEVIKRVNKHAPRYDDFWGVSCESAHVLVLAYATRVGLRPERLVDVGCGTGKLLVKAREQWPACRLFGLDPSTPMLELAKKKLPDATLLLEGVEAIPIEDASMDLVISTTSCGCWEDKGAGFREMARVLRPGASCLVADHPPHTWFVKTITVALRWDVDLQSLTQIEQHARSAGLQIRRLACEGGYNFLHAVRT